MKKIIILLIPLLYLGCKNEEIDNFKNIISDSINSMYQEPVYEDNNPIKVGLYQNGRLVHDYITKFVSGKDITFNIVFSNEENLGSTNIKKNWQKYYQQYQDIDQYKIGFLLEFEADGQKMENLILNPEAKYKTGPYIFVYLYDGIHQKDGARYSHLEMKDVKENTIYSSIKIFMNKYAEKLSSPIKLTVFTYLNDNDFDINNYYRGNSKYTIYIKNK